MLLTQPSLRDRVDSESYSIPTLGDYTMIDTIIKYTSVAFLISFFVYITLTSFKELEVEKKQEQEPEQFVLVDDIIFEVFNESYYE
jgi:large-conductance mechanosensitive channel